MMLINQLTIGLLEILVCQAASAGSGITAVLDATHSKDPETKPRAFFMSKNVPYFKVDVPIDNLMIGMKEMLEVKGASNGFLIFHSENGAAFTVSTRNIFCNFHLILQT